MPAERDAGIIDDAFVQWRGNQRPETPLQAAVNSVPQTVEQGLCVRRFGTAASGGGRKREWYDEQLARGSAVRTPAISFDFGDRDIEPDQRRARSQQCRIRDDHEVGHSRFHSERQAQFRADTGGLAGRDYQGG